MSFVLQKKTPRIDDEIEIYKECLKLSSIKNGAAVFLRGLPQLTSLRGKFYFEIIFYVAYNVL